MAVNKRLFLNVFYIDLGNKPGRKRAKLYRKTVAPYQS